MNINRRELLQLGAVSALSLAIPKVSEAVTPKPVADEWCWKFRDDGMSFTIYESTDPYWKYYTGDWPKAACLVTGEIEDDRWYWSYRDGHHNNDKRRGLLNSFNNGRVLKKTVNLYKHSLNRTFWRWISPEKKDLYTVLAGCPDVSFRTHSPHELAVGPIKNDEWYTLVRGSGSIVLRGDHDYFRKKGRLEPFGRCNMFLAKQLGLL